MSQFLSNEKPACPGWLLSLAKADQPIRVAIARASAASSIEAAKEGVEAGLVEPIFVGECDEIRRLADQAGFDISAFELVDATGEEEAGAKAAHLCGAGDADVLMKGQLHTDVFMKAALNRDAGLRTGNRLLHQFVMLKGDQDPVVISDAAVNVAPDLETRQEATSAVVKMLRLLGRSPRVAFLSATESPLPAVPSAIEGRELCDWAKSSIKEAAFSGPLAMDLIFSAEAVAVKGLSDDPVAGQANGIIVPEIVSGNALFKAMVYMAGACAGGLVIGGKVPILLTSRADPPAARLASMALSAIWARG